METVKSPAEHRVILHNTSWNTYQRLLKERGEGRVPRFAYDRGELEIMSPSTEHESIAYYVGLLVAMFAGRPASTCTVRDRRPSTARTWNAASSQIPVSTLEMQGSFVASPG
jgi:Uma2 family endonuclease